MTQTASLPPGGTPKPRMLVRRIAQIDGWTVVTLAGLSLLLAVAGRNVPIALACLCVAASGALELRGAGLLVENPRAARRWLIGSQALLFAVIFSYCAWRLNRPDIGFLRSALFEDSRRTLREAGISEDEFLLFVHKIIYVTLAAVSLLYQGGLALFYAIRVGAPRTQP